MPQIMREASFIRIFVARLFPKKGGSTQGLLIGLAVTLAVALGAWYFTRRSRDGTASDAVQL
jgi:hypothetical protein